MLPIVRGSQVAVWPVAAAAHHAWCGAAWCGGSGGDGGRRGGQISRARSLNTTATVASGHNKWSKIRHKKTANDAARASVYSGLSREIIAAIRNHPSHSTSTDMNARLATLLRKARDMDVPKDKIEATLKKAEAMGAAGGGSSVTYEALGPNSKEGVPVALIVECLTDSPGRTRSKVKEAFNKSSIRMSSTAHLFERKGIVRLVARPGVSFDDVFLAAVELGAEDVHEWDADEGSESSDEAVDKEDGQSGKGGIPIEIVCSPTSLHAIAAALDAEPHAHTIHQVEAQMIPAGPPLRIQPRRGSGDSDANADAAGLGPEETAGWISEDDVERLDKLLVVLEENADCERIWSNIAGWPER